MAVFKPLSALKDRWHSPGHYSLANMVQGRTLDPRETTERLSQREVDQLESNSPDRREQAQILSLKPAPKIENPFNRIKARIEEAFAKNESLQSKQDLKKPTLDFVDTLEFGIVDRPDRQGQYVTAYTTDSTFDLSIFDYKKLPLVLDILNTELGVREFMNENMGVMTYGKKAFLTAGQLVLNFTEVNGQNILELMPEQQGELARFMSKGNASVTFCNGDVNSNSIFLFDQPLCPADLIMANAQTNFNGRLKALADGDDGPSNFKYTPRRSIVPAANKYPDGQDPYSIGTISSMLDQSTPGYVLRRLAQAVDSKSVFIFKDSNKPNVLVDSSTLPGNLNVDDFVDDLRRRLDPAFVEVNEADHGDLVLRDEIKIIN